MSDKKIIQFDAASQVNSDAYVPITQLVNGNQKTLKALIDQLGAYISRVQNYNDLDTTDKSLIGAINEAAQSGPVEMEQTVTTPVSIASFNDGGDNIPVKSLKVLVSAVQSGSGTPSPSNIRSISGWSGANVTVCGKNRLNVADKTTTVGSYIINNEYVPMVAGYYVLSFDFSGTSDSSSLRIDDENGTTIFTTTKTITSGHNEYLLNLPSKGAFVKLYSNAVGTYSKFQIEQGNQFTAYEPYTGTTHNIPFNQTVYGGVLDVTKGVLTVDYSMTTIDALTWDYDSTYTRFHTNISGLKHYSSRKTPFMCECFQVIDDGRTVSEVPNNSIYGAGGTDTYIKTDTYTDTTLFVNAYTGKKIVYPLATPTTIQLTPTQVKTILNQNNIFADTGDIDTLIYFNSNADEVADVVEAYVGEVVNLYATLATGNTSVTISSSAIHTNSTIDIYTDNDVDYISAVVTEGQIVITFEAQASNLGVKVRVS